MIIKFNLPIFDLHELAIVQSTLIGLNQKGKLFSGKLMEAAKCFKYCYSMLFNVILWIHLAICVNFSIRKRVD
jgi:hypothetical protein